MEYLVIAFFVYVLGGAFFSMDSSSSWVLVDGYFDDAYANVGDADALFTHLKKEYGNSEALEIMNNTYGYERG